MRAPHSVIIGFHPAGALHRRPGVTHFGARVALMIDPFGNTLGLKQVRQ